MRCTDVDLRVSGVPLNNVVNFLRSNNDIYTQVIAYRTHIHVRVKPNVQFETFPKVEQQFIALGY